MPHTNIKTQKDYKTTDTTSLRQGPLQREAHQRPTFVNVCKCVDSSSGATNDIKEQRRHGIMKAKQQRDEEFADLPSPEDCEAASKGA